MSDVLEATVEEELALEEVLAGEDDEDEEAEEPEGGEEAEPEPEDPPAVRELREQNQRLSGWAGKMRHENQALAKENQRLQDRFGRLLEALAEKEGIDVATLTGERPAEEPIPDPDEDVTGHIVGSVRKMLGEFKGELSQKETEREQQARLAHTTQQIQEYHEADVGSFSASYPDYDEAETFLLEEISGDLERGVRTMHPRMPDDQVQQTVNALLTDTVTRHQVAFALEGLSLAEYVYRQAVERGYEPGAENGDRRPARQRPPRTAAERLKVNRQRAGKSLAAASGSPGKSGSLKGLLDMSDDEFDQAIEGKDFAKIADAISGG